MIKSFVGNTVSELALSRVGRNCRFFSTYNEVDTLTKEGKLFIRSLQQIDNDLVTPHLKQKTDLISKNDKDGEWSQKDGEILSRVKRFFEIEKGCSPVKHGFVDLMGGLIVHTNHRADILGHPENKKMRLPENGALIRALYLHADGSLIRSSISSLKKHKIIESSQISDEAYISAEIRRLIRKTLRVAGSIQTANQSAVISLMDAACIFPLRDKAALERLEVFELANKICEIEKSSKVKQLDLRDELEIVFSQKIPAHFQVKDHVFPELLDWTQRNAFGFNFSDLLQKYENQGLSNAEALQKIVETSDKTNAHVNSKAQRRLTYVSQQYIDDIEKTSPTLLEALESDGLSNGVKNKLYKIVSMDKKHFHTQVSSQQNLESILDEKIFNATVVWHEFGLMCLRANLENGITAFLLPGHEDRNTTIRITDGVNSVRREIPDYWLENWTVVNEKK